MLDEIWNGILELLTQFVIPDWGAVIALLPVVMLVLIVVILANLFLRIWRTPKPRRGKTRITPRTPAGIHMPGPSWSPALAALGVFLLMLGLVFGGPWLWLGAIATVLTLLYWLAEAIRTYDRDLGATAPPLPVPDHAGPPPGVHMPGPSFRPLLGSIGMGMLMLGLVFGGWLLAAGVIALIATLVGWLFDARREYVKVEEADLTGHLENPPAPRAPSGLLWTLGVLFVAAVVLQAGWLPPRDVSGGEGAPASGEPPASGAPPASGGPGGSGGPGPSGDPGVEAEVTLHARDIKFLEPSFTATAGKPFKLAFVNEESAPHNVEIKDGGGASLFKGEIFPGPATRVYDVPNLAAGEYTFICSVHPNMTGTATLE
jgi:plastocyanin